MKLTPEQTASFVKKIAELTEGDPYIFILFDNNERDALIISNANKDDVRDNLRRFVDNFENTE